MAIYVFPDHIKGDTFDGESFTINVNNAPVNLTGAIINMDLRKVKTAPAIKRLSTLTGEMTITVPQSGIFQINQQVIDVPPAKYFFDIEIHYPTGVIKTYIEGTWTILQDVTYGQ